MNIALLAGDGIGPEVIDQAVKVSNAIATKFGHEISWTPALTGSSCHRRSRRSLSRRNPRRM